MLSELAIQRGNIAILGESHPLSIRQHSGNAPFHSEQTLLAGETLLTFARQQVFTWGLLSQYCLACFSQQAI